MVDLLGMIAGVIISVCIVILFIAFLTMLGRRDDDS